jgi:hypothetical protein
MPAWQAIPLLANEWLVDPAATEEKVRQFIQYHEQMKQPTAADMYRCALVQLRHQMGVDSLGFMHVVREGESYEEVGRRLRREAGA